MTNLRKCLRLISAVMIVSSLISSPWLLLLLALMMRFPHHHEKPVPVHPTGVTASRNTIFEKSRHEAEAEEMQRCGLPIPNGSVSGLAGPSNNFEHYPALKRMVQQNLRDQRFLLIRARFSLLRWAPCDQRLFLRWFGTTAPVAREAIWQCVNRELALNARYSAANFTLHHPLRPNVLASVRPDEPGVVYIDAAYLTAPRFGFDGQASTLVHEFSHFRVVYGSEDIRYGEAECLSLARKDPRAALHNADNLGGYIDQAGR